MVTKDQNRNFCFFVFAENECAAFNPKFEKKITEQIILLVAFKIVLVKINYIGQCAIYFLEIIFEALNTICLK